LPTAAIEESRKRTLKLKTAPIKAPGIKAPSVINLDYCRKDPKELDVEFMKWYVVIEAAAVTPKMTGTRATSLKMP
jgi:hypothetical protein